MSAKTANARKRRSVTRALPRLGFVAIGLAGGLALGGMAVGDKGFSGSETPASYADLTGNPAALSVDSQPFIPCDQCADGYGVAAQLRLARQDRLDDSFRQLGAVAIDYPPIAYPEDEYRYGGRFPDTAVHVPQTEPIGAEPDASARLAIREVAGSKLVVVLPPGESTSSAPQVD